MTWFVNYRLSRLVSQDIFSMVREITSGYGMSETLYDILICLTIFACVSGAVTMTTQVNEDERQCYLDDVIRSVSFLRPRGTSHFYSNNDNRLIF